MPIANLVHLVHAGRYRTTYRSATQHRARRVLPCHAAACYESRRARSFARVAASKRPSMVFFCATCGCSSR